LSPAQLYLLQKIIKIPFSLFEKNYLAGEDKIGGGDKDNNCSPK
jgi:hypothetical protein